MDLRITGTADTKVAVRFFQFSDKVNRVTICPLRPVPSLKLGGKIAAKRHNISDTGSFNLSDLFSDSLFCRRNAGQMR